MLESFSYPLLRNRRRARCLHNPTSTVERRHTERNDLLRCTALHCAALSDVEVSGVEVSGVEVSVALH